MFSPIREIINEAKKGKIFILVDDENRENEGDLVISGDKVKHKDISFMAKYGRGLICLALESRQVKKLDLQMMKLFSFQYSFLKFFDLKMIKLVLFVSYFLFDLWKLFQFHFLYL